ncbi:MAG: hypothetical protein KF774_00320 [Planctomyces sp.]|nr:hypothetical protein [Planctomyces sp.]
MAERDIAVPAPAAEDSLLRALIGDGRPFITLTGLALLLSGVFAFFLSATKHFLPHDVAYLGMTADALCGLNECRIVHFMIHDRVAFGGAISAVGVLYLWLAAFPLRTREPWAWQLLIVSGVIGFGSFLAYLGYGYLDTWHGAATLALLPAYIAGTWILKSRFPKSPPGALLRPWRPGPDGLDPRTRLGRTLLIVTAAAIALGGLIILSVGVTSVFVPQDLAYMRVTVEELDAVNPRLVPLIAHDRAGFGGGVCCCGVMMFFALWCSAPSRHLWEAVTVAGTLGFATAIFIHPAVGYNDAVHLAPAVLGSVLFVAGVVLSRRGMLIASRATPRIRSGNEA